MSDDRTGEAQPGGDHIPVLHTAGGLPEPTTAVGTALADIGRDAQREQAAALYTFLTGDTSPLLRLNEGDQVQVALVNVPKTKYVKVVYALGVGTSPIGGMASQIDDKILLLHGDGGPDIGPPQTLCVEKAAAASEEVWVMSEEQFTTTITTKGPDYSHPLIMRNAVLTSKTILKLAPLPAYLVYDGIDEDLDAALVLERVMAEPPNLATQEIFVHLKSFLRACLSSHNNADNKPYVGGTAFTRTASGAARRWAKVKFARCFPTLGASAATTPATMPPAATGGNIAEMVAALRSVAANPPAAMTQEPNPHNKDDTKGMSAAELETLCVMCGEPRSGTLDTLPGMYAECAAKGASESFKLLVIQKWIMAHTYYEDADVPLTHHLLNIILKRSWTGKDSNVLRPSFVHAMEGLSPFLMLDLDEDQVATLNSENDLLSSATLVSVDDLCSQKKKLKVKIPEDQADFMLMLRRYANLLYAAFLDDAPLFKLVREVIRALRDFSREARKRMTLNTKGSILWIILLQSRQFAIGEMGVMCEFQTMHNDLRAKRANIHHSEMPLELLTNSTNPDPAAPAPKEEQVVDVDKVGEKPPKKSRQANPNNWHLKLKAALEAPLKTAGNPSFTKIMNFCGKDAYGIVPKGSNVCAPNLLFGTCFHGEKCTRTNKMATDGQVKQVLELVDKFIKDPAKLKIG